MLMTQFVPELGDHGVHLVFEMEFLFFELDFLEVVLLRQVVAIHVVRSSWPSYYLCSSTRRRNSGFRGHQVFLDLLLLHHHRRSSYSGWKL